MDKTIILGAGITGLAAGSKLKCPIYEASNMPGGICRSYYKSGYRFENGGGHWIFGAQAIKNKIGVCFKDYKRKASIYYNQYFPYPIQGYEEEGYYPSTLKGWLVQRFGNDLCRMFFWPFNNKYTDGLYEMVVQDDPGKTPMPGGSGYNDVFSYPEHTGLDTMIDQMADGLDIHYNKRAVSIDLDKKIVTFKDGSQVEYDRLVSTIPLKEVAIMAGIYKDDLPHTSVLVLNIGAEKGLYWPKDHWVYIPDPKIPFHRIGLYSNVDPLFAPPGRVSLYVEKAFQDMGDFSITKFQDDVVRILRAWGWIGKVDICDPSFIPYAYTWMLPGADRAHYIKYLKERGIDSIGRYGRWKFQGVAESITEGWEVSK